MHGRELLEDREEGGENGFKKYNKSSHALIKFYLFCQTPIQSGVSVSSKKDEWKEI